MIAINGSPRKNGNTSQAFKVMADELEQQGIEVEIIQIGQLNIYGCIGCGYSISVVRRAGGVDVVHQLNNYLNLAQTVMSPSQYWTLAYGLEKGEVHQDEEGIQTLRKNARSMDWLLKTIDAGKEKIPVPVEEDHVMTNFIR